MSYSGLIGGIRTGRAIAVQASAPARRKPEAGPQQAELEMKLATLQKDYAELHTALIEAAQVYRRLCAPHLVRYGDFEIASETFAVRHIPGDFVTIEETTKGIVFTLGDICGKGLSAGMWTTHMVGLVSSRTKAMPEPKAIAAGVNRDLCLISSVTPLASLFVARLDPGTGWIDYCSAGHPPALWQRSNGRLESLTEGGPLLGVVPAAPFDQGRVQLGVDDTLLICSDGILESFNQAEEEFGNDRLEAEFRMAQSHSAAGILFSVLGAVQDFAAPRPLTDDMTLVVVRRNSNAERKVL